MEASGFLISCARLDDSSATASSRSARRCSSSRRFESEMSVKIAVTRGGASGPTSSVVVVTPMRNVRSDRRTVASTRMARTPRRAVAVTAAQNSGAMRANSGMTGRERHSRSRKPRICSAAGLQYSSRPSPSTVTTPVGMLRSTSAASSRTCRSSPARASRSAPITDTRLEKYAVTAATMANTASWMAMSGVMVVRWPKNTSAKYTMPTRIVTSAVLAGGISTAVTAIRGT